MLSGPPNGAGFAYGQENTYFRIGLVLAILKVVFPDLELLKQLFILRETFITRGNGLSIIAFTNAPSETSISAAHISAALSWWQLIPGVL